MDWSIEDAEDDEGELDGPTDTELLRLWEENQVDQRKSDGVKLENLKKAEEVIGLSFAEIVSKRNQGILTDESRVGEIVAELNAMLLFSGVKASITLCESMRKSPPKFSWIWWVAVAPTIRDDLQRWDKFVAAADASIRSLKCKNHVGAMQRGALFGTWFRSAESYISSEIDVAWPVNTHVWDGPPAFSHLRKNWVRAVLPKPLHP